MTQMQKVIKYIAISFAFFLIVTIISLIITGSNALLSSLGLIDKNIITTDLQTISSEITNLSSLKVDLNYTNLYIKKGEKLEVQTNNTKIKYEENNGKIEIKEKNRKFFNKNVDSNLIIYIPNFLIDELDIDSETGKINIESLEIKELDFELGAGAVYLERVSVSDNAKIDGGLGKTELINCNFSNLKASLGMGEFIFSGTLKGKNEINSGIGASNIELTNKDMYTISVSKGLGSINLDGEKIESDQVYGNGNNYLEVNGGIGKIDINFKD